MIAAIQTIRGGTTSANPVLPVGYIPPGEISPRGVIGGLPFDEEPEEFLSGLTPLPYNTPTAADDPDGMPPTRSGSKVYHPGDTELLPDEDEEERDIPSWMSKRRDQSKTLEDTHLDSKALPDDAADPQFEAPAPGNMDSTMRLDRKELEPPAETAPELPLAVAEDLDDWLTAGPPPKSHDSSPMIEIAAHLAPTQDEVSSSDSFQNEHKVEDEPPVAVAETAEPQIISTDSGPIPRPSFLPPVDFDSLPEGDFVEMCALDAMALPAGDDQAILYRPALRPPTIKLFVLDDGSHREGEWHRIREERFIIGRTEGDLTIEYDRSISGRHAEIARVEKGDGVYDFMIRDLGTTNGTFARASRATLESGQEFLLGYRRYKIICNCQDNPKGPLYDKLIEVQKKGGGKAFRLGKPPIIIGRDPTQCNLLILDDPFLSPVHAVLKRDQRNRWVIKNFNSKNGVWIQIQEMKLSSGGEFQIGAQRFIVQMT
jgi:pSer/pThr/pTyr-binding forkhead associated (FHA) protein